MTMWAEQAVGVFEAVEVVGAVDAEEVILL